MLKLIFSSQVFVFLQPIRLLDLAKTLLFSIWITAVLYCHHAFYLRLGLLLFKFLLHLNQAHLARSSVLLKKMSIPTYSTLPYFMLFCKRKGRPHIFDSLGIELGILESRLLLDPLRLLLLLSNQLLRPLDLNLPDFGRIYATT